MIAYKLFHIRKDNTIGPLFINRKLRVPVGEWLEAEYHPTKGFAVRPGWHCCFSTEGAPHIKQDRDDRIWCKVEVDDFITFKRSASQGGEWILANKLKVLEVIKD